MIVKVKTDDISFTIPLPNVFLKLILKKEVKIDEIIKKEAINELIKFAKYYKATNKTKFTLLEFESDDAYIVIKIWFGLYRIFFHNM